MVSAARGRRSQQADFCHWFCNGSCPATIRECLQVRTRVFWPTQLLGAAAIGIAAVIAPALTAVTPDEVQSPLALAALGLAATARLLLGGVLLPAALTRYTEARLRQQFCHETLCGARAKAQSVAA